MNKQKVVKVICVIILILGIGILLYPGISQYLYEKNSSKAISSYDHSVDKLKEEEIQKILDDAHQYNEEFYKTRKCLDRYWATLNVNGTGMMGYIVIPKLDTTIPIYHGTQEYVLQSGIGHYEDSSMPVGGNNTHSVLTGHTGLSTADLFSDIDKLKIGDMFFIKVLDKTFAYTVDQILVVEPNDMEAIRIQDDKDYVTLITCTPYGVNTHRLLVRGERTEWNDETDNIENVVSTLSFWERLPVQYRHILIGILFIIIFIVTVKIIQVIIKKTKTKHHKR